MAQTKVQLLQPNLGDVIDFDSSTLFMDGADNRVGIRNTNPQYELDVTGTVNATNFRGNISVGTIDDWITHTGDTNTKLGFPANDQFSVETGGSQRLLVQNTGAKVTGTLELTDSLYWDGDTNTTIDNAGGTADWIRFQTGGITVMDINSSQNVHIHDDRRLRIGASNDIQIFHNSGNNRNYFFSPQNNVYHEFAVSNSWTVQTTAGDKRIECTDNGTATGVDLFHNGSMKLRTTSSGVYFSGTDFGFNTTPGGNPAGKAVFIAIGDSDTGIVQDGDGQLELWANNNEVANINAIDGYTSTKLITTSNNMTMGGRLIHHGDTDTYMEYTDNQIDFVTGGTSRMYIQNSAVYVRSGLPLAFLSSSGATPNIKSGGTNNQDLLFTTGSTNPTRLQITSGGQVQIPGGTTPFKVTHTGGDCAQFHRGSKYLGINADWGGNTGDSVITASTNLVVHTNGSNQRLRITSGGHIIGGNQINDRGAVLQIESSDHAQIGIHRNTADHGAPAMNFSASRGTSAGANNLVQDNDYLGMLNFKGADGSDLANGAYITAIVDGTAASNKMPTRLGFWTSDANSQSPTERLRIDKNGDAFFNSPVDGGMTVFNMNGQDQRARYQFYQTVGNTRGVSFHEDRGDANPFDMVFSKARGGNGTTSVNSGDQLGRIIFSGADGTRQVQGAMIQAYTASTGTIGSGRMPGRMMFRTGTDHASAGMKNAIIINERQNVQHTGGSSWHSATTNGDFKITVRGLTNNGGNNWRKCAVFVMYNGINPDATNSRSAVGYYGVGSVSTWNWFATGEDEEFTADPLNVTLDSATTTSFRLNFNVADQNTGSVNVFVNAYGNSWPNIQIDG